MIRSRLGILLGDRDRLPADRAGRPEHGHLARGCSPAHPRRRRAARRRPPATPSCPRAVVSGRELPEWSGVSDTQRVNQPGREEAVVRAGEHPIEHERPEDWGWHGETGKKGRIGAVIAIAVPARLHDRQPPGKVEDLWIVGIALVMIIMRRLLDWRRRKNAWRSR